MNTAAQRYKNNSVETANPRELTLMLFNGAITFLKKTKQAISNNDVKVAHENNLRVQDIISELIITLDRQYPIAEQLLIMYDYMLRRMIDANISKDISIIDEVEGFFVEFRDTWKEAMALAKER